VLDNIKRKERSGQRDGRGHDRPHAGLLPARGYVELRSANACDYERATASGPGWEIKLGDCVEIAREIPDDSIDFSIFSPPFSSLYTYSNSVRDMGNSAG
jgi:hypothetical protein